MTIHLLCIFMFPWINWDMEHLSDTHVENYQHIIKQIEDERRENETLREKIAELNKKIIANGITLKKDFAQQKIFKVLVKIFNSVFEIYDLFSEKISREEIESLSEFRNRKFYFVEIYVSRSFQDKIISQNWLVNVHVQNSKSQVNKCLSLKNKVLNPICVVVPFDHSADESLVEITIAWPSAGNIWPNLKIASIPIDISHHIESYSDYKMKTEPIQDLLQLSRLYNPVLQKSILKQPVVEYKFFCKCTARELFEAIIKNCYYKFDPRKKSSFAVVQNTATAKFFTGGPNLATVKLNPVSHVLQIEATPEDLCRLKKHFFTSLKPQMQAVDKNTLHNLTALKKRLRGDDEFDNRDVTALINIYSELRGTVL